MSTRVKFCTAQGRSPGTRQRDSVVERDLYLVLRSGQRANEMTRYEGIHFIEPPRVRSLGRAARGATEGWKRGLDTFLLDADARAESAGGVSRLCSPRGRASQANPRIGPACCR